MENIVNFSKFYKSMNVKEKKYAIVFDMNGVLFSKNECINDNFEESPILTGSRTSKIIYLNASLRILSLFFESHSFYKIAWTTMMKKNCECIFDQLKSDFNCYFDKLYSQEDCKEGIMTGNIKTKFCIKDLRVPAENFALKIENCLLIDDSCGKNVEGQNFYHFGKGKNAMIEVLKYIDKFIKCEDENCLVKKFRN